MATVKKSLQREVFKLLFWQLVITMALSILILMMQGFKLGLTVFLGAAAYLVPNSLFAWRLFSYASARSVDKFIIMFFFGEVVKLVLSGIIFVLLAKYLPVNVVFLLAGYTAAIVSFWFVSGWRFGGRPA